VLAFLVAVAAAAFLPLVLRDLRSTFFQNGGHGTPSKLSRDHHMRKITKSRDKLYLIGY
jgi:hypothetical protein